MTLPTLATFRLASKPSIQPGIELMFELAGIDSATVSASFSEGQA